jgi:dTDP-4-amino-4,6-dideoxygalactose transaminase
MARTPGHFPLTESIARRTLALPFFNRVTADQQQEVADALREAMAGPIECPIEYADPGPSV